MVRKKKARKGAKARRARGGALRAKSSKGAPLYEISARLRRQLRGRARRLGPGEPLTRPLRIYTFDPSLSSRLGGVATVDVPYEALEPGPMGGLFAVDSSGAPMVLGDVEALDLDERSLLLSRGLAPTPADGRFHCQMVYAVCNVTYAHFRRALGREITWATAGQGNDCTPLIVKPFAFREDNAYFDRDEGGLFFGYFQALGAPAGYTVPKGEIFTALSHDVVAHETAHALLDGLRAEFYAPTNRDVLGFHEGFADLVALFQHFGYPSVVEQAMREARGALSRAPLLTDLAREFGFAQSPANTPQPLRSAIDVDAIAPFDSDAFLEKGRSPRAYRKGMEEHDMGSVLVSAVFEAFATIVRRKTERYFRIAGIDPARVGEANLGSELIAMLAREASDVASQFLDICIRAIDYCPPVDMELGEYLRAIITADADIAGPDKWGYREALMRSFRRRRLFPDHVKFMTEDAVRWRPPECDLAIPELAFDQLRFADDPGRPAGEEELLRQANAIGAFVTERAHADALHLVAPGAPLPKGITYANLPSVESVRCARRVAPDGRIVFDLVAEVLQTCTADVGKGPFDFMGGCTLVIGPDGKVRYAIYKKLDSEDRVERQHAALRGALAPYWAKSNRKWVPKPGVFKRLHAAAKRRAAKPRSR